MPLKLALFSRQYFRILIAFTITICLIRVYEYFYIASKSFLSYSYTFELAGLFYDIWACFIYSALFIIPYLILSFINNRFGSYVLHIVNVLLIVMYLALIVVFSERNTPFDHEFFTRSAHESWLTTKQMMASGIKVYIPFIVYISLYFIFYNISAQKWVITKTFLLSLLLTSILAISMFKFSNPPENTFKHTSSYYLVCNKFIFWVKDSYHYFITKSKFDANNLNNKELEKEIDFYQQNQPFEFTGAEYPLLHLNNSNDVLGGFFNLTKTAPNIVILVVEGLSRDFSGENAYAGSFTPFLDSLSKRSLVWNNFLSTAPGTFAAHPAITGSLPYGKRGFSLMSVMPNHLSLIKILRLNGYHTNFMIGFNPDFDNMGGYIRLQGTDFILSKYGPKYKQMGVGSEGWSMGFPDDALFSRSFEVMDSIKKFPYLNIYHTATTHMPYLFAQKPVYDDLFDKKMKTLVVSNEIKRTLKQSKKVLVTYMFADDCIKKFFADYSKRPEFNNTIFFITGDHHIGSFPSTCNIDDYHVPLIVYSPMLKEAKHFLSVNSHNNLAPTISALILNNYQLPYKPKEVNWMADVLDTCASFRNLQSMPFMAWSREMEDYIYKDYMLSGDQLYKLTPNLMQEPCTNDSMKKHIARLLENFKIINSYVCDNNKIFPPQTNLIPGDKELLFDYYDSLPKTIFKRSSHCNLMSDFKIPKEYKYLFVEVLSDVNLPSPGVDEHPAFQLALIDKRKNDNKDYLYWSNRDIVLMTKNNYVPKQWNTVSTNDMFTLDDYTKYNNLHFELAIYTDSIPVNLKIKQLKVKIYGIKAKNN